MAALLLVQAVVEACVGATEVLEGVRVVVPRLGRAALCAALSVRCRHDEGCGVDEMLG